MCKSPDTTVSMQLCFISEQLIYHYLSQALIPHPIPHPNTHIRIHTHIERPVGIVNVCGLTPIAIRRLIAMMLMAMT